jgi:hypothetical protein
MGKVERLLASVQPERNNGSIHSVDKLTMAASEIGQRNSLRGLDLRNGFAAH